MISCNYRRTEIGTGLIIKSHCVPNLNGEEWSSRTSVVYISKDNDLLRINLLTFFTFSVLLISLLICEDLDHSSR
jgi:hypothetical protein